jgi:branched-chain amino acid transport system permease protein
MYLLFRFTQTGHKMIAVSQDQTLPLYYGISVKGVFGLTWALAGIVGGFGGILLTSANYLAPVVMGNFIFKGFTAAVIGGLTSVPGVFVGGFILGIVENLVAGYISVEWTDVIASIMIFGTLIVRPRGLFGAAQQRRV